jgi:ABC-2 type transport system permease protein
MIPDSFAGERERKTLETLLASRLPDRAIVLGKIFVAVAYGWGASLLTLIVSLLVVNLVHWNGNIMLYAPRVLLVNLALGLLISALAAGLGVPVSLRSRGVQEAQQILVMILMLPPMIAGFVVFAFVDRLRGSLRSIDGDMVVGLTLAALALLCAVLLWIALRRFDRDRITRD